MGMRWLCSSIIIIVIISTSNTQSIASKWKIEDRKPSGSDGDDKSSSVDVKKANSYKKLKAVDEKSKDSNFGNKHMEKLLQSSDDLRKPAGFTRPNSEFGKPEQSTKAHARKKRMIWVSDDGRLALPPGTVLSISPTLSMPLVRYPPTGFLSNLTMSFPLTIDFDKLGLTDNENPLGILPPIFGRSMGRAAGSMLASYMDKYLHTRKKREAAGAADKFKHSHINAEPAEDEPELPDDQKHIFHGGERALLYGVVEDLIGTFGLNGRACVLRTICEVHSKSVHHLGLFGEMAKLFFTASKSKFSDLLPEYVLAEKVGEGSQGPGECFPYYKDCPRSLFKAELHKYSDPNDVGDEEHDDDGLDDEHLVQLHGNEINEINNIRADSRSSETERFKM